MRSRVSRERPENARGKRRASESTLPRGVDEIAKRVKMRSWGWGIGGCGTSFERGRGTGRAGAEGTGNEQEEEEFCVGRAEAENLRMLSWLVTTPTLSAEEKDYDPC